MDFITGLSFDNSYFLLQKPVKYKVAVSKDSEKYFQRYRSQSLVGDENLPLARLKAIADGAPMEDPETPQPKEELEEERYPESRLLS